MPSITISQNISGVGGSITGQFTRTGDGGLPLEVTVPKGYAGTLSTRTDNDTGTATLGNGHGITTGMAVDIYWSGGAHYGFTAGTVSGNSVPFDISGFSNGDNLPSQGTAIIMSPRVSIEGTIDPDTLVALALQTAFPAGVAGDDTRVAFWDQDDQDKTGEVTMEPGVPYVYDVEGGIASPLQASLVVVKTIVSTKCTTDNGTFKLLAVHDASTP
jgi:hypothetical protein